MIHSSRANQCAANFYCCCCCRCFRSFSIFFSISFSLVLAVLSQSVSQLVSIVIYRETMRCVSRVSNSLEWNVQNSGPKPSPEVKVNFRSVSRTWSLTKPISVPPKATWLDETLIVTISLIILHSSMIDRSIDRSHQNIVLLNLKFYSRFKPWRETSPTRSKVQERVEYSRAPYRGQRAVA